MEGRGLTGLQNRFCGHPWCSPECSRQSILAPNRPKVQSYEVTGPRKHFHCTFGAKTHETLVFLWKNGPYPAVPLSRRGLTGLQNRLCGHPWCSPECSRESILAPNQPKVQSYEVKCPRQHFHCTLGAKTHETLVFLWKNGTYPEDRLCRSSLSGP